MNSPASRPDLRRIGGEALIHVLDSLLSLPATEGTPVPEAAGAENEIRLLATVALIGDRVSGAVRLQIPEAFARHAAVVLLGAGGTAPHTDAQIDDLSGELGNMVAGRVAADLGREGFPCTLGTPEVIRGTKRLLEADPAVNHAPGGTDWSCQGHPIRIDVCCHHRPT